MQNNIGLQIAGSAPGFTVLFSNAWKGDDLAHSSVRKESVLPVYYEVCFDRVYWTYVLVLCNFLSNVNREESFKIGIRFPARHYIVDSNGETVSPAIILGRILDSLKATALTRRGTDTYRLRPDAHFPASEYEAILAAYHLREIWGPTAESVEDKPDIFFELRNFNPEQPLLRLPYMASASGASKVYVGSFSENVDKLLFSHVELAAAPIVKVKIEGKDSFFDYSVLPGDKAELFSSNYGYPDEAFEPAVVELSYDDIIRTAGECLDDVHGEGFELFKNTVDGVVKVRFAPKPRTLSYSLRIEGACDDAAAVAEAMLFNNRDMEGTRLVLRGMEIPAFRQAIELDSAWLKNHLGLPPHIPRTIKSARLGGDTVVVELDGLKSAAEPSGATLLVRYPKPLARPVVLKVRTFSDASPSGAIRETVFPAVNFEAGDGAWFARLHIGAVGKGDHTVVYLDNPASAECMAFADDKGVYMADFGRSGRSRGFVERLADVFGLTSDKSVSASWRAVRWLVLAAVAIMLLLGGAVAGHLLGSALEGVGSFIQKMK